MGRQRHEDMDTFDRILDGLDRNGDHPFLTDAGTGRTLAYGEFHRLACGLGARLVAQGIRMGDRVAIILNNSVEMAALYFTCLYAGLIAVPINPQLHRREVEAILERSGARATIVSPSTEPCLPASSWQRMEYRVICMVPTDDAGSVCHGHDTWSVDEVLREGNEDWKPFSGVSPENLFVIMFTSGTTGQPKGVSHRISGLLQSAEAFNRRVGLGPDARLYHVLAMSYMAGFLNTLLCPFLAGASVVVDRPFDARLALEFWDAPVKYGVNTLWLVPTMLAVLLRLDRAAAGARHCREHIRTVCVGTAPLGARLKRDFEHRYGVQLLESYGLSETLFVTTNSRNDDLYGSVGRALPGVDLHIVDEQGAEVPLGQDGEILIRTPFLMAGYLNDQTLRPDFLDPGAWFPSGDIGHLRATGHLYITGRKKDLIIRNGLNISPRLIEETLLGHRSVTQAAVVGLPHDLYGEEVVAVVKLEWGTTLAAIERDLAALCKAQLSSVCVPSRFVAMEELPTNPTGKIQKAKLRGVLLARLGGQLAGPFAGLNGSVAP